MKVLVPAKINTLLYLLHKREDGYHELYSHFVPISLYDSLEIIPKNQSGITLEVDGMDFEEGLQNNLVFSAAELFQEHTSNPFGMRIILKKNIPVGAGLGGGSADAAATLHVLNQLHQNPFSRKELQDLALNLGADVPFDQKLIIRDKLSSDELNWLDDYHGKTYQKLQKMLNEPKYLNWLKKACFPLEA